MKGKGVCILADAAPGTSQPCMHNPQCTPLLSAVQQSAVALSRTLPLHFAPTAQHAHNRDSSHVHPAACYSSPAQILHDLLQLPPQMRPHRPAARQGPSPAP
jgi:hypothetical protein